MSSAWVQWQKSRLSEHDYPDNFVRMQHPEYYIQGSSPIEPEFIYHSINARDLQKIIFRVSWRANDTYIPMSFVLDTTIAHAFYFSRTAFDLLETHGLFSIDDVDITRIAVNFGGCERKPAIFSADLTPPPFQSGNFIGLRGLFKLGLTLDDPPGSFRFRCNLTYF